LCVCSFTNFPWCASATIVNAFCHIHNQGMLAKIALECFLSYSERHPNAATNGHIHRIWFCSGVVIDEDYIDDTEGIAYECCLYPPGFGCVRYPYAVFPQVDERYRHSPAPEKQLDTFYSVALLYLPPGAEFVKVDGDLVCNATVLPFLSGPHFWRLEQFIGFQAVKPIIRMYSPILITAPQRKVQEIICSVKWRTKLSNVWHDVREVDDSKSVAPFS
jgi:hypothetical protein